MSYEEISKSMNKSINSLNDKANRMNLGIKYMRNNNPNFKAIYQEYNWCFERFINRAMSHEEMANEANTTLRTMQKWCCEKHRINAHTFKELKQISEKQRELMMFGLLGDGHIDKRATQPMYIESHAENQKDYLMWKYDILKDLCYKPPSYIKPKVYKINGIDCNVQGQYRLNTRIIKALMEIRSMSKSTIIKSINDFGLALYVLDDGFRGGSNWSLCVAGLMREDKELFVSTVFDKFGLYCKILLDDRYIEFDAKSSREIDKMILLNLPNQLDIVKRKVTENKKIKEPANYYKIQTGNGVVGLNSFCRTNHISYKKAKLWIDSLGTKEVSGDVLLSWREDIDKAI